MSLLERWRRWRRWRWLKARRWYGGEFGLLRLMSDDLINGARRRAWGGVLAQERAIAAIERRRRELALAHVMRCGIDWPGCDGVA